MKSYYKQIDQFSVRMTCWVMEHATVVLIASLLSAVAVGAGGVFLVFSNDYRIFFSDQNPELEAFEALQDTYTKSDNILFVIEPGDDNVFSKESIESVAALTEKAWQIPFAIRVDSVTNFQSTRSNGDELIVEDMFPSPATLSDDDIEARAERALDEPLLVNSLVTSAGDATAINVTLAYPQESVDEVPESVELARALSDEYRAEYPENEVHLTGVSMLNNAFTEAGFADLGALIPIMFVLILFITYLILRSAYATVVVLAVIALSSMIAMGSAGYAGIQLSPISGVAPIIILTVAVADSIHILTTLRKLLEGGMQKADAIVESLRVNFIPVVITSITTIVGFLALNLSDSPPFWHLGNMTAAGIGAACVYSLVLIPVLASRMPLDRWKAGRSTFLSKGLDRLADFVIARPYGIVIGTLIVCVAFMVHIPNLNLNDQWTKYFDQKIRFRGDTDRALDHFGLYPIEFSVPANGPGGASEPEYLARLDQFVEFLRERPGVEHVYSFGEVLKRINRNLNYDDDAYYAVPENRELSAQYLLLYEMSLPYGLDLNDRVNIDKSATRVTATLGNVSTADTRRFLGDVDRWIDKHFPAYMQETKPTSAQVMFTYIAERNVNNMVLGTTAAIIAISVVMMLALGSVKMGLLSLIPNALPILVTFGIWSLLVGEVGFSVAAVASISLGIVVDDSVHFLAKYVRARKERGLDAPDSVRFAFQSVGVPIFVNTVILVIGFLLLTQSAFKVNADMGMLTALAIVLALVLDFLLLPALLLMLDSGRRLLSVDEPALDRSRSLATDEGA